MKNRRRFGPLCGLPAGAVALAVLVMLGLTPEPAFGKAATGPQLLQIQTVPHIAGVRFRVNGHVVVSDAHGLAKITLPGRGIFPLEMLPYTGSGARVRFARWLDDSFTPRRTVKIPNKKFLQVGLDIDYKIDFSFTDLTGAPVSPSRIRSITMKSSKGSSVTLSRGVTSGWFSASRVIRRRVGLQSTDVVWGAESVIVDGDNAVNRGQQRFLALRGAHWTIVLQLHSAIFLVRDAIFGNAAGSSLTIFLPDGSKMTVPLEHGRAVVHSLARGSYYVKANARGFSPRRPLELSKEQNVQLIVISYADIGLVLGGFLLFAGGLFGLGWRLRRKRAGVVAPTPAPTPALAGARVPPLGPAPSIRLPERPHRPVPSAPLRPPAAVPHQQPTTSQRVEPSAPASSQPSKATNHPEPVARTSVDEVSAEDEEKKSATRPTDASTVIDLREPTPTPAVSAPKPDETLNIVTPPPPGTAARARSAATIPDPPQRSERFVPAKAAPGRPRRTPWNPWGLKLETPESHNSGEQESSAPARPQAEGDGPH